MRRIFHVGTRFVTGPLLAIGSSGWAQPGDRFTVRVSENVENGLVGAGGVPTLLTVAEITVVHGSWQGTVWVSDLDEGLADRIFPRDGDAVYVSEAPYAQFSRVLSALLTTTSAAGSIGEFASGNNNQSRYSI